MALGDTITEKLEWKGRGFGDKGKLLGRLRMDLGLAARIAVRTGEVIPFNKIDWDILPEKSGGF